MQYGCISTSLVRAQWGSRHFTGGVEGSITASGNPHCTEAVFQAVAVWTQPRPQALLETAHTHELERVRMTEANLWRESRQFALCCIYSLEKKGLVKVFRQRSKRPVYLSLPWEVQGNYRGRHRDHCVIRPFCLVTSRRLEVLAYQFRTRRCNLFILGCPRLIVPSSCSSVRRKDLSKNQALLHVQESAGVSLNSPKELMRITRSHVSFSSSIEGTHTC